MASSNGHLFNNPRYSDLTVQCGKEEWRLHQNIVCPRSKFFDKACDDGVETSIKIITLDESSIETVDLMLYYLYNLDYSDRPPATPQSTLSNVSAATPSTDVGSVVDEETGRNNPPSESSSGAVTSAKLLINALVYNMADKYEMPELKDLARLKFEKNAFVCWPIVRFAFILDVIHEPTSEADAGLRVIANKICACHLEEFLADEELLNMAMTFPELALGILIEFNGLRTDESKALEGEKARADTATENLVSAIKRMGQLQSELNASQKKTPLADQEAESAKSTLIMTRERLSKCENLLKRMQSRATSAEAKLENEKSVTNQLRLENEALKQCRKLVDKGGAKGGASTNWILSAISAFSGKGCRNCRIPLDRLEWQGDQAVLRCGSCLCRHFLNRSTQCL